MNLKDLVNKYGREVAVGSEPLAEQAEPMPSGTEHGARQLVEQAPAIVLPNGPAARQVIAEVLAAYGQERQRRGLRLPRGAKKGWCSATEIARQTGLPVDALLRGAGQWILQKMKRDIGVEDQLEPSTAAVIGLPLTFEELRDIGKQELLRHFKSAAERQTKWHTDELDRVRVQFGRSWTDDSTPILGPGSRHAAVLAGAKNANHKSYRRYWINLAAAQLTRRQLPSGFSPALRALMAGSRKTSRELADLLDLPPCTIDEWRNQPWARPRMHWSFQPEIERLEIILKAPPRELANRVEFRRTGRTPKRMKDEPAFLPEEMLPEKWRGHRSFGRRVANLLPLEFPWLGPKEKEKLVAEAVERLAPKPGTLPDRLSDIAKDKLWYSLKDRPTNLPPGESVPERDEKSTRPYWTEFLDEQWALLAKFVRSRTAPRIQKIKVKRIRGVEVTRVRNVKVKRRKSYVVPEDRTVDMHRALVAEMLGAAALPADAADQRMRGLGIAPGDLSLGMLASEEFLEWYCDFMWVQRSGTYNHGFKRWSTVVGKMFRKTGYIRLHPETAERLPGHPFFDKLRDQTPRGWRKICKKVCECLVELEENAIEVSNESPTLGPDKLPYSRHNAERIKPILKSPRPIQALSAMVRCMEEDFARRPAGGVRQAILCRNIAWTTMAMYHPLRLLNWALMRWKPDRSYWDGYDPLSNLYEQNGRWRLRLRRPEFKNRHSKQVFGARPPQEAYDVEVAPRAQPWLDRWVREYRPILVGDGDQHQDRLFVGIKGQAYKEIRRSCPELSVEFVLLTERYIAEGGRNSIPGVKPFGISAVRDIVATSLIKKTNDVTAAAQALMDSEERVRLSYSEYLPEDWVAYSVGLLTELAEG